MWNIAPHRNLVRLLQLRWHPDKFMQSYGRLLVESEKEAILKRVKEVSQAVNAIR